MQDEIIAIYSRPQIGGSMPYFEGSRRGHVGGGFFSGLARIAMPILKTVGSRVLGIASRTANDVLDRGQPLKESLINNAVDEIQSVIRKRPASSSINKEGAGYHDIFNKRRRYEPSLRKK